MTDHNNEALQTATVEKVAKLEASKFVRADNQFAKAEELGTESVSFWQDAWRRLRKNKAAMAGLIVIIVLAIMAIIGPSSLVVPKNIDGTPYRYDAAPIIADDNGNIIPKENIGFLPPRIPGLEKIGIADGVVRIERSTWDLLVGVLPKTDDWKALKSPLKRKELVEALEIKYHPFDINIKSIYEEDGKLMADIVEVKNKDKVLTFPYKELVSQYSRYQPENFEFIKSNIDDKGVEMVTVDANYYKMQNMENTYFWFGTDKLALDLWTRLWVGVRISLLIALASLLIDFTLGITYGTIAGFYGGTKVDTIMMRITEIWGSIPALVLMIILISISETIENGLETVFPNIQNTTVRLLILIFAMSLTGWIGVSRVVRAQILKLREREFILAARTLGAGKGRIMRKHLFPNIIGQLMVMATFSIPGAIFYEAFLTFVGIGLPVPMASLGVLVKTGYDSIQTIPSMLLIPAFVMSLLMLSINLLANGLRDALDPRMR